MVLVVAAVTGMPLMSSARTEITTPYCFCLALTSANNASNAPSRFRAALDAWRFSPWSQMFYLHLLADVSRWLDRHGLGPSGLTDANVSAFRQDRRSRGRADRKSVV